MSIEDWETTPEGNVLCYPLVGWETQIVPMNGILRLLYGTSESELNSVQLYGSSDTLRKMSQVLSAMADRIDAQHLGTKQ